MEVLLITGLRSMEILKNKNSRNISQVLSITYLERCMRRGQIAKHLCRTLEFR